jgi:hypothetical protein
LLKGLSHEKDGAQNGMVEFKIIRRNLGGTGGKESANQQSTQGGEQNLSQGRDLLYKGMIHHFFPVFSVPEESTKPWAVQSQSKVEMWKVLDNLDKRCIPLRGMQTARGTNMEERVRFQIAFSWVRLGPWTPQYRTGKTKDTEVVPYSVCRIWATVEMIQGLHVVDITKYIGRHKCRQSQRVKIKKEVGLFKRISPKQEGKCPSGKSFD